MKCILLRGWHLTYNRVKRINMYKQLAVKQCINSLSPLSLSLLAKWMIYDAVKHLASPHITLISSFSLSLSQVQCKQSHWNDLHSCNDANICSRKRKANFWWDEEREKSENEKCARGHEWKWKKNTHNCSLNRSLSLSALCGKRRVLWVTKKCETQALLKLIVRESESESCVCECKATCISLMMQCF